MPDRFYKDGVCPCSENLKIFAPVRKVDMILLPKQYKDIPDYLFLGAIETARTLRGLPREVTDEIQERMPENLIRAKALKLIKRGLIDGCACGCRGDFSLTEKGRQWVRQ